MARFEAKLHLSVNAEDYPDAEQGARDVVGAMQQNIALATERWPTVTNISIEMDESRVELVDEED